MGVVGGRGARGVGDGRVYVLCLPSDLFLMLGNPMSASSTFVPFLVLLIGQTNSGFLYLTNKTSSWLTS